MSGQSDVAEVWDVDLTIYGAEWERYSKWLEESERVKAARFVSLELRQRYAVTRGILRVLAGRKLGRSPDALRFVYAPHGKPSLADAEGVFFNVSHSGNRAIIAFSSREIGVDIERVRPFQDPMGIVRRFFSIQEREAFEQASSEDQRSLFFRCWTRKEAFVKALGEGLALGLDTFTVPLAADCSDRPLMQDPKSPGRWWRVIPLTMENGYVGAVVVDPVIENVRRLSWQGLPAKVH